MVGQRQGLAGFSGPFAKIGSIIVFFSHFLFCRLSFHVYFVLNLSVIHLHPPVRSKAILKFSLKDVISSAETFFSLFRLKSTRLNSGFKITFSKLAQICRLFSKTKMSSWLFCRD